MKTSYSFAVAAICGAMASAYDCPASAHPLPDNFEQMNWREQVNLKMMYMDSCPQDNRISWVEMDHYTDDSIMSQAEKLILFNKMDTDANLGVDPGEYLRYKQVMEEPFQTMGIIPPYTSIKDDLFNYLNCRPKIDGINYCGDGYDRSDLRAILPILTPMTDDFLNGPVEYDLYVSYEMTLRDYDRDGIITRTEQTLYTMHYNRIRDLWVSVTSSEQLSLDEFKNLATNPWVSQGATLAEKKAAFKKLNLDKDNYFSFDDLWKAEQEDDIHWRLNDKKFHEIDSNDDLMVSRQEVVAYLEQKNPDSTPAEIQAMADEQYSITGEEGLGGEAMWNLFKGKMAQAEADVRDEQRQWYQYNIQWMMGDADRNGFLNLTELTLADGTIDTRTRQLFDHLGLNINIDDVSRENVYDNYVVWEQESYIIMEDVWLNAWSIDIDSYTSSTFEQLSELPAALSVLGVADQAELEGLFAQIDSNGDGTVDGEEACRYYIADYDMMCKKFELEQKQNWLRLVKWWNGEQD